MEYYEFFWGIVVKRIVLDFYGATPDYWGIIERRAVPGEARCGGTITSSPWGLVVKR